MRYEHLLIFGVVAIAAWLLFIYFWPRLMLLGYKRAILVKGLGGGPIPVNTLYVQSQELFADPLHLHTSYKGSKLATTGVSPDLLYVMGWLDLRKGAQVVRVPDMAARYYSVQLTDPSKNINFAYIGTRATGTKAGEYLITGPGWKGVAQNTMKQISSPNNFVLVVGRVLVENEDDLPVAYNLAKQIQVAPFIH